MAFKVKSPIQVGGMSYKIELVDTCGSDAKGNVGTCNNEKLLIKIATQSSDGTPRAREYIEECIWHELLHAIENVFGADIPEEKIESFAQGLFQISRQVDSHFLSEDAPV